MLANIRGEMLHRVPWDESLYADMPKRAKGDVDFSMPTPIRDLDQIRGLGDLGLLVRQKERLRFRREFNRRPNAIGRLDRQCAVLFRLFLVRSRR
jgi:hypothetical protein